MSRPITVRLVGGLGNQLFGYYAGAALAAHHGVDLRLDTSWTRHGVTDHGIEILNSDLPGLWLDSDSLPARLALPGTHAGRAIDKALRKSSLLRKLLRIHETPGVGHDPTLMEQPPGIRIRGYFQSWRMVQSAIDSGYPRRPALRAPSAWLDSAIERAEAERPLAVHVRRGDYTRLPGFGLLGPKYYERAIERLRTDGVDGPIWLFSDDPAGARKALGRYADDASVISSPEGPATEMLAMSYAAANVLANSTFSWWGVWMNDRGTSVAAPQGWFAAGPTIDGLVPPQWSRIAVD